MDWTAWIERFGEPAVLAVCGALVGAGVGFFGQRSLRAVELSQLLAAEHQLDELSFRRARHVLTENQRTLIAAEALAAGDLPGF